VNKAKTDQPDPAEGRAKVAKNADHSDRDLRHLRATFGPPTTTPPREHKPTDETKGVTPSVKRESGAGLDHDEGVPVSRALWLAGPT
jgi:hypothetical protein